MDAKAFLDSLLASPQSPAEIAAELSSRTTGEQQELRTELVARLESGQLAAPVAMAMLRIAGVESLVPELVRLLHSASAPLDARASALTMLRQTDVDVLSELKSLDPDAAADIATEAVLLQDEGGTLLDVLSRAEVGEDDPPR
jgi:hypothetical protein